MKPPKPVAENNFYKWQEYLPSAVKFFTSLIYRPEDEVWDIIRKEESMDWDSRFFTVLLLSWYRDVCNNN